MSAIEPIVKDPKEQQQVEGKSVAPAAQTPQTYKFGGKEYSSVDDLGKAYEAVQSEYGKWTSEYDKLKKQYEDTNGKATKWEEWWKTVAPLWGEDVEDFLRRKLTHQGRQGQTVQQQVSQQMHSQQRQQEIPTTAAQYAAQQQQQTPETFDFYRPEEITRFKQNLANDLTNQFNAQLGQVVQGLNQALAQKEQWYQQYLSNHLSLMRRAFEQKIQDPSFNVDAVMEQAAKAIGGQVDPIELGKQLIDAQTFAARLETAKKDAYAQGKKDFEQEVANKKQEVVTPNVAVPKFTVPTTPNGTRRGLHTLRETVAESLVKKFGPQGLFG